MAAEATPERAGAAGWLRRRGLPLAALALLWGHFLVSLPGTLAVQRNDFVAYYRAARSLAAGETADLYSPHAQWFVNLPVVGLALVPLGALDYATAWRVFWGVSLAAFLASYALVLLGVARHFPPLTPARAAVAAGIMLCFAPVLRRCLHLGQTTPLVAMLLTAAWLAARSGRGRGAGAILGVVCSVKIPPLLLLPLLALRRRLGLVLPALAVVAIAVAASWALFGAELLGAWADLVIRPNVGRAQAAFNNQSLDAAWMRLLTAAGLLDWQPAPRPPRVTVAVVATALALAALLLRAGHRLLWPAAAPDDADPSRGSLELELALGVCLMVLLFPVIWLHYYLFLAAPLAILPFWWIARDLPRPLWLVALLAAGTWLASGSEVPGNVEVARRREEPGFRLAQNRQPLGALLLVAGLSVPLAELGRRARPRSPADPSG